MRWVVLAAAFALTGTTFPSQDTLSDSVLKDLKAATVLLRDAKPDGAYYGAAYLFRKQGSSGFLITSIPFSRDLPDGAIEAVFYSGEKNELAVPVKVVARSNLGPVLSHFPLTIFRVESKSLPKIFDIARRPAPRETQAVFSVGFSLRPGTHTRERRPAVAYVKASISSLRKDDAGKLVAIQIDIASARHSGGLIVDSKGGFVGLRLGSIWETRICLVHPPDVLDPILQGRIEDLHLSAVENSNGRITFEALADAADPVGAIKSAQLLLVPRSGAPGPPKPGPNGAWSPVAPDMVRHDLKSTGPGWSARVTLQGELREDVDYVAQIQWTRADGSTGCTAPFSFLAEFQLGDPARTQRKEWLGTESAPPPEKRGAEAAPESTPVPVATGEHLRGLTTRDPGLQVTTILHNPHWIVRSLILSPDGKWLYLLDMAGSLRMISLPELVEERCLPIGVPSKWIDQSREGLLILTRDTQDLWVIDPGTLQVKQKVGVGLQSYVTSSLGSSLAFGYAPQSELSVIDLKQGKIVNRIPAGAFTPQTSPKTRRHREANFLTSWDPLIVSADGKFLFVRSHALHRFRIEGSNLECEEIGPPIRGSQMGDGQSWPPSVLVTSPDSKNIALRVSMERMPADQPKIEGGHGSYIFRTDNLQKPARTSSSYIVALDSGDGGMIGVDVKSNRLRKVNPDGSSGTELPIFAGQLNHQYLRFAVHPSGRSYVGLPESGFYWLEFDK